jgi:hypothetical protein
MNTKRTPQAKANTQRPKPTSAGVDLAGAGGSRLGGEVGDGANGEYSPNGGSDEKDCYGHTLFGFEACKGLRATGGTTTLLDLLYLCSCTAIRGKSMMSKDYLRIPWACYPTGTDVIR